ncbi:hypothetical protein AGDE_15449 [Angomonas deanei]|uniref:Uncharacterized protein n=1 Tax=Angomonas deanei TaxID=59799 RepID=A0A7G2CTW1_9TRYP|nr:hypothetical protein AGDE_15449 [Angomonas deanei]CAD2221672.1 hypothetical protein, conserved [Angomonas deanei]|eukprot:EPY19046.1 hypothetical protein AGDE_15449 [Angomonas deanei]
MATTRTDNLSPILATSRHSQSDAEEDLASPHFKDIKLPPLNSSSRVMRSATLRSRASSLAFSASLLPSQPLPNDSVNVCDMSDSEVDALAEEYNVSPTRVREVASATGNDPKLMKGILASEQDGIDMDGPASSVTLHYGTREMVRRLMKYLDLPEEWEPEVIQTLNQSRGDAQIAAERLNKKVEEILAEDEEGTTGLHAHKGEREPDPLTAEEMKKLHAFFGRLDNENITTSTVSSGNAVELMKEFPGLRIEDANVALQLTDNNLGQARAFIKESKGRDKSRLEDVVKGLTRQKEVNDGRLNRRHRAGRTTPPLVGDRVPWP